MNWVSDYQIPFDSLLAKWLPRSFFYPFVFLSFFLWRSSFGSRNRNDDLERSRLLRAVVVALLLRNFIKSSHDWVKKRRTWSEARLFSKLKIVHLKCQSIIFFFFFLRKKRESENLAKGEKRAEEGVWIDRFESFRRDIESATKFSFRSNLKTLIFESVYAIPIFRQNRFIDPYKRINSCNKAKNSKNQTVLFFLPPSISAETIDRFSFLLFFFFFTRRYI